MSVGGPAVDVGQVSQGGDLTGRVGVDAAAFTGVALDVLQAGDELTGGGHELQHPAFGWDEADTGSRATEELDDAAAGVVEDVGERRVLQRAAGEAGDDVDDAVGVRVGHDAPVRAAAIAANAGSTSSSLMLVQSERGWAPRRLGPRGLTHRGVNLSFAIRHERSARAPL